MDQGAISRGRDIVLQRTWIVAGSIVVGAFIVAAALVVTAKDEPKDGVQTSEVAAARTIARDRAAQSALRNALAAAKTHWVDGSTYLGFDPDTAAAIEPSLIWSADSPAVVGVVTIDLTSDTDVVMSTVSQSGQAFCIADSVVTGVVTYGTFDAHGTRSCDGGW